ncbi:MAG: carboxymuconolactone decarboxylase family protein, partial [Thermoplasmatales archaeon]
MESRIDYKKYCKDMLGALTGLERAISESGLESSLLHLAKMRASQLNGCGWCPDMHSKDALIDGENIQIIILLGAWWGSPQFSDREKAALAWAERVTLISEQRRDDAVFENLRKYFSDE